MRRYLLGLFIPFALSAQPAPALKFADSARTEIEAAQLAGDVERLRAARALVERALVAYPGDALLMHYQGYALYREASALMGRNENAAARGLVDLGVQLLEQSAKRRPMAETSALLSMMYGQQIGLDPSKAMTLGMEIAPATDEAVQLGPDNPRVALVRGISAMFTPPEYGGGVPIATGHLEKAVALFTNDHPAPGAPAWGRAEVHAWLGQAYQRAGDATRAAAEYQKALEIEPGYVWVRQVLLPSVKR